MIMLGSGAHLVDLAAVRKERLHDITISQHGRTVISRYGDDAWNLAPYLAAKNTRESRILFSHPLRSGHRLTDPAHSTLLASVKRFLYMRWRGAVGPQVQPVSASTVRSTWSQIRQVVSWMTEEHIASFSELTPEHCARFAASIKRERQPGSVAAILSAITAYYNLRHHLVDRLPQYPWPPEYGATTGIARTGRRPRGDQWTQATTEVIPLRIMKLLLQASLDYVENRAEGLLNLRDHLARSARRKFLAVQKAHREIYPDEFTSIFDTEAQYLRVKASHRWTPQEAECLAMEGYTGRRQVETDLVDLRTACYIICAAFSGMRDSELASLEVDCFVRRRTNHGETICWLKGTTYKLERTPRPAEWMVPEVVEKAVAVATRLGLPQRAKCAARIKQLRKSVKARDIGERTRAEISIEIERAKRGLNALLLTGKESGKFAAIGRDVARRSLQEFARRAGIKVEQKDMEGVIRRDRIRPGGDWPFTPHQFRRTFAVYVAKHVLGDVRYLREHFKHWSLDMTLYYARHDSLADRSLFGDIMTERDELQSLLIESWLHPQSALAGKGGRRIMAFRARSELKTARDMRDLCRKLGENVFVRGTGHSWCMASGNGCGGQGLYDAVRCTSCGEAVIDATHIEIWKGIREQQVDVLNCSDLGEPSKQRCIDHLRAAEQVLSELGADIPPSLPATRVAP